MPDAAAVSRVCCYDYGKTGEAADRACYAAHGIIHAMRRFHLLTRFVGLLCASLLFVACSDGRPPSGATGPSIALDELPTGLGRGYPQASVKGIDNDSTGMRVGDLAPNFQMRLDDGRTLTMDALRGRPVLLNH